MTTSRRALLLGATLGGVAAGAGVLAGCDSSKENATAGGRVSPRMISEAEKVAGLKFTAAERAQMVENLEDGLQSLAALRGLDTPNQLAPALKFDPRLPGKRIAQQRNVLALEPVRNTAPPPDDRGFAYAGILQLGAWLRAGALTSVRLTEIFLERMERYDGTLKAFITPTPEIALAQARAADRELGNGRDRGPLHGIPYGLKDLADTKGVLTTWGAEPYRDRVPDSDASIVRRLAAAGAVLLGKTSCGAIAYGDQWFGGRTRNPWNAEEGSSGSSAGSASAVAAGLCAFAIGTETLGSIISPSERCGVVGLRPTFGRVSRSGFMALCWSLDKVGPLCRSVEDAAIVLSRINGYDMNDPSSIRMGFAYDSAQTVADLVVGYDPAAFDNGDEADRAALDAVRKLGVKLEEFRWPDFKDAWLEQIVIVEAAAAFSELTLSNRDDELAWQDKQAWPNTWRSARFMPAVDYVQIDRQRRRLMAEMNEAFSKVDVVIGPHYASGALLMSNCTGHPQLALPAGFASTPTRTLFDERAAPGSTMHRTPRGVSLWSDIFEERKILTLGRALEGAMNVKDQRPPGF